MIRVNIPASMVCEESGCGESKPVELALLTGTGGFAFRPRPPRRGWLARLFRRKPVDPEAHGWQFSATNPGAPFSARCPKHHARAKLVQPATKLQVGPAGPRIVTRGV